MLPGNSQVLGTTICATNLRGGRSKVTKTYFCREVGLWFGVFLPFVPSGSDPLPDLDLQTLGVVLLLKRHRQVEFVVKQEKVLFHHCHENCLGWKRSPRSVLN